MLRFLAEYSLQFGPLRIFDSITFRAVMGLLMSFVICLWLAPRFIRLMQKGKITENMHKDLTALEDRHSSKQGTPTMGGAVMLLSLVASVLLACNIENWLVWDGLILVCGYGLLGFIDDYMKFKRIGKLGLSKRQKLFGQILIASIVAVFYGLCSNPATATKLLVPFSKWSSFQPDLGLLYYPLFVFVIVACSNAVNLTDGLDGLASGCTISVAATYSGLAYVAGNYKLCSHFLIPYIFGAGELSVVCAIMIGCLMGFLWFNAHPAKVFMGDTGSLAIGGLLGFIALVSKQELVLPLAGGIFVAEAMSVIIQVFTFRVWNKRYFLCAPLHHHLELSGWSENHVVVRLWMVGALLAAAGLGTLKLH